MKSTRLPPEMQHRCNLLCQELLSWPGVTTCPMFGYRAFHYHGTVFAMLPDKRPLEEQDSIWYKRGGKWHFFQLDDDSKVAPALQLLANHDAVEPSTEARPKSPKAGPAKRKSRG